MIANRDYVYVFGPEWGDALLEYMEHDLLARRTMIELGLTSGDVRRYYLTPPHFERVYRKLLEQSDDFVTDPVELVLREVKAAKDLHQRKVG